MKVFITRYALTAGPYEAIAKPCFDVSPRMIAVGKNNYFHGNDWHETKEAALKRCEEMRVEKLKSLSKSAAKIAALNFEAKLE